MDRMDNKSMAREKSNLQVNRVKEDEESSIADQEDKMSPANLSTFLPWACAQFNIPCILHIKYVQLISKSTATLTRNKTKSRTGDSAKNEDSIYNNGPSGYSDVDPNMLVKITFTYSGDDLTYIKIDKTKHVPRELLCLISIIAPFYPHLCGISINSGADKYTIHEMLKICNACNITEINLDNTWIKEGYHDTILDNAEHLRVLSLARCKLGDEVIQKICSKLEYVMPPKGLSILNLSTNQITDKGAEHIAQMLRTNRQLKYLNLAGNMVTEDGADEILNVLCTYPCTRKETLYMKNKRFSFLKTKQKLIDANMTKLWETEMIKIKEKRKLSVKKIGVTIDSNMSRKLSSEMLARGVLYAKAVNLAESVCGTYDDPLAEGTFYKDGVLYSNGNQYLTYLNLAYNNISNHTLKKILNVLKHQRSQQPQPRSPGGLVNICFEGNPLPKVSPEVYSIDNILDNNLTALTKVSRKGLHSGKAKVKLQESKTLHESASAKL